MNKIKVLKMIDRIAGKFLISFLGDRVNADKYVIPDLKSILVIRPGGIGDAVLLLPAINTLKTTLPHINIDILCEKRNAGIFEFSDSVKNIFLYDRDFELFRCLRKRYDAVIDTEQWHRLSAIVAHIIKSPIKIGFDTNERRKLFTYKIPYNHEDYEVYSFLNLIKPLINISPQFNPNIPFINIKEVFPSNFLRDNTKKLVAIFPGATVIERKWGGDKYGMLAKALENRGYNIVILGSNADRKEAEKIKKHAQSSIDLTGKTSLKEVAVVLKYSSLLITADSGIMHIAYGIGTPTVSLFGSGIEKKWAPQGENHIILNKHLPCSPCTKFGYTPPCPNNFNCMNFISVDEVISASERILHKSG